jgi:Xaa-Pro aminopeptidase
MGGGGQMVLFDDKQAPFLSAFNPRVAGVRSGASFFCTVCGDGTAADATSFAGQVLAITTAHAGSNRRLADDKIMVHGLRALERGGFAVPEGEAITERVRAIKGPDAVRACAAPCTPASKPLPRGKFARTAVPKGGVTEAAIREALHAGNIRGGKRIETRLLEPGMVLCVAALVSPEGGDFSIALADQVLITETGHENLTR